MTMFLHRYISMITTIKIFTCWYIKKVLKNVYAFFTKLLGTAKQLYLLFEKSGNFSQSEHRDRFDSSPPRVCFHLLFKDPPPPSTTNPLSKRVCWKRWKELMIMDASASMHLNIKTNNGKNYFLNQAKSLTSES